MSWPASDELVGRDCPGAAQPDREVVFLRAEEWEQAGKGAQRRHVFWRQEHHGGAVVACARDLHRSGGFRHVVIIGDGGEKRQNFKLVVSLRWGRVWVQAAKTSPESRSLPSGRIPGQLTVLYSVEWNHRGSF